MTLQIDQESAEDQARFLETCLKIAVALLFLTPNIDVLPSLPSVRVEEFLLLSLVLIALFRISKGGGVHLAWGTRQNILVLFSAFIVFSILLGTRLGFEATVSDLNQLIRLGKYLAVYTLAVTVFRFTPDSRAATLRVFRTVTVCAILLTLVVVQQYFNLFGLNESYIPVIAPTAFESLVGGYPFPRPVGLIGNPNELGFIFVVSSLVTIDLLVSHTFRLRWLAAFGVQVGALVLTMSRTSLAAFLIGAVWLSVSAARRRGSGFSARHLALSGTVLGVLGGIGVLVVLNQEVFQAVGWRFARLLTGGEIDTSLQARIGRWKMTFEAFTRSPIFGLGPLRHTPEFAMAADSEWLLLLRSYGIVGTAVLITAFVGPHLAGVLSRSLSKAGSLVGSLLLSSAVYMLAANVYHSLALMPLLLIVLAAADPAVRGYRVG